MSDKSLYYYNHRFDSYYKVSKCYCGGFLWWKLKDRKKFGKYFDELMNCYGSKPSWRWGYVRIEMDF